MDVNVLKDSIIRKQDEVKVLEGRIKHEEREIQQLNRELHDNEEHHEREMQALSERLPVFDKDESQLPPEIAQLKEAIFSRISELESTESELVNSAVRSAQVHQKLPYLTVEQKLERRAKEQESQRRKGYIQQLLDEKQDLLIKLEEEQQRNSELESEISATEQNICKLRENLRNIMAETVEDRSSGEQPSSVARKQTKQAGESAAPAVAPRPLPAMRAQIADLQEQLQVAQRNLRRLGQLTAEVLGERNLLEKVRSGAALSEAEKDEVSAAVASNVEIQGILRELSDAREKAARVPRN